MRGQPAAAGFRTVEEQGIAADVLQALHLGCDARRAPIEERLPGPLRRIAPDFSGFEGSTFHRALAERAMTYVRLVLTPS